MESSFQQPAEQQLAQADSLLSSNANLLLEGRSMNCLEGFVFAFTGTFARSRETMRSIVLMRGGGYSPVVTKLITHFVVGQNPEFGEVWMAKRFKKPMINEVMFLNIIKVRSEPPKSFTTIRVTKDQLIPQVISGVRVLKVENLSDFDVNCNNEAPPVNSVPATRVLLPQQQQTTSTRVKPRNASNALDLVLESKKASSQPQVSSGSSKTSNPAMTPRQSENIPPNAVKFKNYYPSPTVLPTIKESQATKILKRSWTDLSSAGVEIGGNALDPTVRPTQDAQATKIRKVMTIPKSPIRYHPALTKDEIQKLARCMSRLHRGHEEIPEVKPDCLKGYEFVINGLLHSISRVQAVDLIKSCGGVVDEIVTKSATHMILGTEIGHAKLAKAEALGIRMLSEDEFLNLILGASAIPESFKVEAEADVAKESPPMKEEIKTNEETTVKTESTTSQVVKVELPAPAISKVEVPESAVPSESQVKVAQITPKTVLPPSSVFNVADIFNDDQLLRMLTDTKYDEILPDSIFDDYFSTSSTFQ